MVYVLRMESKTISSIYVRSNTKVCMLFIELTVLQVLRLKHIGVYYNFSSYKTPNIALNLRPGKYRAFHNVLRDYKNL